MMKKLFLVGVVISLIMSLPVFGVAATESQPAIMLNGTEIDAAAFIERENIYLPLRVIGETLGYEIQWLGKDNTISVFRPDKNITIDLNSNNITANDHTYYMGEHSIIEDSTYMGEDFFSDNFGLIVRLDRQNGIIRLESVQESAISIKTVKDASETNIIKITLQYPQVDGLADKAVQDSINAFFSKKAADARSEGLKNAGEMEKAIAAGYTGGPNRCETYFDYRMKYNQNGLLSVVFLNYQYSGGAHGLTVQSSHTFNLDTGEEYRLKDLVKSGADYVSLISNIVRDEINEEDLITPFEAIKEDQDFYLSNDAVVVYFQQYEYFPYVFDIQEFPVEFSVLKDMLKPEFSFLNQEVKYGTETEQLTSEAAGLPKKRQL